MGRHTRRQEMIEEKGYCECNWSSPSSHHDCCLNDGCGKVIKTASEALRELENQIEALSESWKPIGSAPEDGTRVLLAITTLLTKDKVVIGYFSNDCWHHDAGFVLANDPSHWMPLPEMP